MPRERDRTEMDCAHCGERFGKNPDAVLCVEPVTDGPSYCRRKGVTSKGHIETCKKLAGHAGKHRFSGKGDPLPADPTFHEACYRAHKQAQEAV